MRNGKGARSLVDLHPPKVVEEGKHPTLHYEAKANGGTRPVQILIVEDNAADLLLTKMALRDAGIVHEVSAVRDGERALALLRQQGKYAGFTRPDIVLLDINLPGINGYQVLAEMRADKALQRIPVVVISGIAGREDMKRADKQPATAYLEKPIRLKEYLSIAWTIKEICNLVELPAHELASQDGRSAGEPCA